MTYKGYKTIELIICMALIGNVLVGQALEKSPAIVVASSVIVFGAWGVVVLIRNRRFPQWKGLAWNKPWKVMILILIVAIVLVVVTVMYDLHIGNLEISAAAVLLAVLYHPIYELWYTIKYELDKFDSVEELFKVYPEARSKIQRPII